METSILEKIEKLPVDKQKEVEDFVDFLTFKIGGLINGKSTDLVIERGFGGGKGIFGTMSDDFDEPLDEFKEYM